MPWIQNVSFADVMNGHHIEAGENSMLIQIVDPDSDFPKPLKTFKETYRFRFLDVEKDTPLREESDRCSEEQAANLVRLLQHALENRMHVVVHCHAGICRSGAVAEVGVMMGFQDAEAFRSPNLLVKHLMMKALGWAYDENEPTTINGEVTSWGLAIPKGRVDK